MAAGTVKYFNESEGIGIIKINDSGEEFKVKVYDEESPILGKEIIHSHQIVNKGLQKANDILQSKQYDELFKHGFSVFEDSQKFAHWLKKPNGALNGKIPADIIHTKDGIKEVDKILGRIEHGIFS